MFPCRPVCAIGFAAVSFLAAWMPGTAVEPARAVGLEQRFKQLDRNANGKVTAEETGNVEWFRWLDRAGKGYVTLEDLRRPGAVPWNRGGAKSSSAPTQTPEFVKHPDLRYAETPGVERKFHSLDVYSPRTEGKHPVLVFIHGGGWRGGDKSSPSVGENPARFYCGGGFVYVSINYRLTPAGKHPANIEDVAKAVAWVHDNIEGYGGDPEQMSIMGHSAGGHLAALVATDEKRLMAEGKSLGILKRAVLLDPAAYDIPRYMKEFAPAARSMRRLYESAFGTDPAMWADASPQQHIAPDEGIPPMLMFYTGARMNADKTAPAFAAALTEAGSPSRAVDTLTLSHADILRTAAQKDQPLARMILRFLRGEDATTMPAALDARESGAAAAPKSAAEAPDKERSQ